MTFHIIAYPNGVRAVVGTVHAREVVDVIPCAAAQASLRGEYVDVEHEGRCVDACDGAGPAHGHGEFRWS